MDVIKIEITNKETIKPISPTPQTLKTFKLSIFDQLAPIAYTPILLFFAKNQHSTNEKILLQTLKSSFSKTLTKFYPLAGRIKDNVLIECNDHGAEFLEARVYSPVAQVVECPKSDIMRKLLPTEIESPEAGTDKILLVQVSFFSCGGVSIGVCISHKIADGGSISLFIKSWAENCPGVGEIVPEFNAADFFPAKEFPVALPAVKLLKQKCMTKRFVFNSDKIEILKGKARSSSVENPTRVEVISSLIWKSAMAAGAVKKSGFCQMVNLRERVLPFLSRNCFGNLQGSIIVKRKGKGVNLECLVSELRKGKEEMIENYGKRIGGENGVLVICENSKKVMDLVKSGEFDFYVCTSLCGCPFYDVDFGFGKPIWLSLVSGEFVNFIALMDSREGNGIEAWVTLSEEEMRLFESNEELLAYSSSIGATES